MNLIATALGILARCWHEPTGNAGNKGWTCISLAQKEAQDLALRAQKELSLQEDVLKALQRTTDNGRIWPARVNATELLSLTARFSESNQVYVKRCKRPWCTADNMCGICDPEAISKEDPIYLREALEGTKDALKDSQGTERDLVKALRLLKRWSALQKKVGDPLLRFEQVDADTAHLFETLETPTLLKDV